jgi:hypothetical protein
MAEPINTRPVVDVRARSPIADGYGVYRTTIPETAVRAQ